MCDNMKTNKDNRRYIVVEDDNSDVSIRVSNVFKTKTAAEAEMLRRLRAYFKKNYISEDNQIISGMSPEERIKKHGYYSLDGYSLEIHVTQEDEE